MRLRARAVFRRFWQLRTLCLENRRSRVRVPRWYETNNPSMESFAGRVGVSILNHISRPVINRPLSTFRITVRKTSYLKLERRQHKQSRESRTPTSMAAKPRIMAFRSCILGIVRSTWYGCTAHFYRSWLGRCVDSEPRIRASRLFSYLGNFDKASVDSSSVESWTLSSIADNHRTFPILDPGRLNAVAGDVPPGRACPLLLGLADNTSLPSVPAQGG